MGIYDKNESGWQMERDRYALVVKYWEPPKEFTEEYWDQFIEDIKAFNAKHKELDKRYVEGQLVPLIRRLERIEHERRS